MNRQKCDIIIPVYNAYEDLKECVESVFKNTDEEDYYLILIDDKSTDARIGTYFKMLESQKIKNLILLRNDQNMGFVKTVNKGMSLSKNDVLLLNSDTVVTKNWLKKIREYAYKDESVATVTPLTNNGTICSVPNFCEDNNVPEHFSLEEFAERIEKISLGKCVEIPTAVGFCMYIKREALDKVGLFDEVNFGKGYGEENDFCCRLIEHGFINVICDNTFIYHKGSLSFKEEKRKLIEKNSKILLEKHPYYDIEVHKFIQKNPLKDIQENIKLNIKLKNKKNNILFLIHNGVDRPINHPRGGTEFHTYDIIKNLNEFNSFIIIPSHTSNKLYVEAFIGKEKIMFEFNFEGVIRQSTFHSKEYKEFLQTIITYFQIDLVHVQHLKGHTFDIVDICEELNIPCLITLHDFYMICPTIEMLDTNKQYCKTTSGLEMCRLCIKEKFGYDENFLDIWQRKVKEKIIKFHKIITPSQSTKEIFQQHYKDLNLNIDVIEHGVSQKIIKKQPDAMKQDNEFKVAFIGGLAPYKGSDKIHDIIQMNKDSAIKWFLIGNLGDQKLSLLEREDLVKYGRYEREEIVSILRNLEIDLVCILSCVPETYAYTLSESLIAGIPVLVTDVGALGERVKKYGTGWMVPPNANPLNLLEKIQYIKENREEYVAMKRKIKDIHIPTILEMCRKYENIYQAVIRKEKQHDMLDSSKARFIFEAYKRANISISGQDENINLELYDRVVSLEREIQAMKDTLGWKILEVIRRRAPYLIKLGKKVLYFLLKKGYTRKGYK
ncbi:glycosyltransferase [Thermotalea metallivorans]|uniref:glycosyltransferase n=1 Tax=Thermotalea metallivorans TaxID=520762 RepID=UPI000838BA3B|nr:glycosyltransferase [Thermotalea metallivorans]